MPSKKEVAGRCRVCDEVSHGFHFGVIVCRACAAFFRRTVALDLKYKCRFDGRCIINKSMRCMCRECRHNKCLKVGMKPDAVQLNRDSIGHALHKERTTVIVENSPSSSSACSVISSASPAAPTTREMLLTRVNSIFEAAVLHRNDTKPLPSILDEMLLGYREIQTMRECVHAGTRMIETAGAESEEEETERTVANCETFAKMTAAEVELAARMVTHFRPFLDLPSEERMALFTRFWPHFLKLERAFATYLKFGSDVNDERIVLFNGAVTNNKNFLSVFFHLSKLSISEVESLFLSSHEISWYSVNVPLKLLRPTEFEFIAMCGHMLWTAPGLRGVSRDTQRIARETRAEIYTALHHYYIDVVNLPLYAPRIGEFSALMSATEKVVARKKEDALIIDLFDLFKIDMKVMDIFR